MHRKNDMIIICFPKLYVVFTQLVTSDRDKKGNSQVQLSVASILQQVDMCEITCAQSIFCLLHDLP